MAALDKAPQGLLMMRNTKKRGSAVFAALCVGSIAACNSIVGLDDLTVSDASGAKSGSNGDSGSAGTNTMMPEGGTQNMPTGGTGNVPGEGGDGGEPVVVVGECKTNQDCIDKYNADPPENAGFGGAGGDGNVPAVCIKPELRCAPLLSEDCDSITGDYTDDNAVIVGSLFSTKGPTAATNIQRQQAAALGIEQINTAKLPPAGNSTARRPLVMVHCDETTNLVRAAEHLVKDLKVPAIVGPNTSQDTLDVSAKVTIEGGTVVMTPSAVASSIVSLDDDDLTWLMAPSDVQRAPLMISQINEMEAALKVERAKDTIKLGIVSRNDALGIGTRTSLNTLKLNGKSLSDNVAAGNASNDQYDGAAADQAALVTKYVAFKPDIIVLAGTAEAITKVMNPLEAQWGDGDRPHYVLIDSTKVPDLLTAATNNEDLRVRVRGTGITPGPMGANTPYDAYEAFKNDYLLRYPGGTPTISGMGPSHDAAYAIGLALAATKDMPVSGASVVQGLRKLASGPTKLTTLGTNVLAAFQKLASGGGMTAVGTFGVLDWDTNGAVKGGTLEMWCIGGTPAKPAYAGSGLTFDIMTQSKSGAYKQCGQ